VNALAARNRRTAVLTLAGIGFFHLVAFGVVMLLLSAGRSGTGRVIPQRPDMRLDGVQSVARHADRPIRSSASAELESHWTAHHKDASGPWKVDAQGRIHWR
jgi:hypothetical protein